MSSFNPEQADEGFIIGRLRRFVGIIKSCFPAERIILVRHRMADTRYIGFHLLPSTDGAEYNSFMRKWEDFFISECGCRSIDIAKYYFSKYNDFGIFLEQEFYEDVAEKCNDIISGAESDTELTLPDTEKTLRRFVRYYDSARLSCYLPLFLDENCWVDRAIISLPCDFIEANAAELAAIKSQAPDSAEALKSNTNTARKLKAIDASLNGNITQTAAAEASETDKPRKYKVVLYADDWRADLGAALMGRSIFSGEAEIIGVTSDLLTAFKSWSGFPFIPAADVKTMDYDYIVACDFDYDCPMKKKLMKLGFPREKIMMGRALQNPYFTFDKYRRVHEIPGGITILAEHCFGGLTYHDMDLEFQSPIINMFIYVDDFLKLVGNVEEYFKCELKFERRHEKEHYPVCSLGDVELHLNHYDDFDEAKALWDRRVKRVNYNNILVETPLYNMQEAEEFLKLPYRKVGFADFEIDSREIIYFKEAADEFVDIKTRKLVWEYALDNCYRDESRVFPRFYDPYKLLLGEPDFRVDV